jgi:hypothetical protein
MATYKVKICNKMVEIPRQRGKAIRAYCTDCSSGNIMEVQKCPCTYCPLYTFRGALKWESMKEVIDGEI